jgi:phosphoglycerate dehydrogenase-like enzyme
MNLLIVLRHPFELWNSPAWLSSRIHADFPVIDATQRSSYDGIEDYLREAEIVIAWSIRPEQFKQAQKLRWIHSPAAAVHQLMFPELIDSDVLLTNSSEVHGGVVAEHVMSLVLALAKRLPQAARFQQRHMWGQEALWLGRPRPREIAGATLGLLGLGSIGRRVAKSASALGMRVLAVREHLGKEIPEGVQQVFASSQLDEVLTQSDYVVLATPVTPATLGLMNAARLAKMKPDACLINVGRGPLVDEAALAEALREHKIGGAALDVFKEEPLPSNSPLWDLDDLFITPHTAGITEKLWDRHYALISENLRRYLEGKPLLGVVNKRQGY